MAEREHGDWTEPEAKALLAPWIDTYLLASPLGPFTSGTSYLVKRAASRRSYDLDERSRGQWDDRLETLRQLLEH